MLIPDNFAQANLRFTGVGLPTGGECVLGFDVELGPATPTLLNTALATAWGANMNDIQSTNVSMTSILTKFGPNDTGPFAVSTFNIPGSEASAVCAPNTAFLIHKSTGIGGRQGSGRMFLPGPTEAQVDANGNINAGVIAAYSAKVAGFLADLEAEDLFPVL